MWITFFQPLHLVSYLRNMAIQKSTYWFFDVDKYEYNFYDFSTKTQIMWDFVKICKILSAMIIVFFHQNVNIEIVF